MDLTREILDFLYSEAELLDQGRYREWLDLLTEDILYQVPVRLTRERLPQGGYSGISEQMFHLDEDRTSLEMRVARLETGFAWAEDPPSRLRHFVTNVRIGEPRNTPLGEEVGVRSYILVFRSRWDQPDFTFLSAERHDVLRRQDGSWKLARRLVILDHATLPTHNLSFFL
ncbi:MULTISPECIES: 3-phenylpropionate/cinnamic acid dioxygenase subunit beta [Thermus]|uniref:3-phenylpropionate dioxygenase, subunit beta n=1 Tax=Thermus scotoductus (strain ATCC 700910 / SA-01) TaxID=743525 RepID=E8PQA8_THESS|nr:MULTISPECIES: 3-phenylpropionate/cinnamic acid dioxygenase subunit beta [Thermus]ADW21767.1 3-phenylpropionate dioxygenase, subunit beta [Thermus scotoductus SA-01]